MDNVIKKKNIKPILKILVLILGLGLSLGAVYFVYYIRDNKLNNLSSALISINLSDSGSIILNSGVPLIDDAGLKTTPHNFTITNTSQIPIDVNIKLNIKNTTTFTTNEYSAVRYGLYINDELINIDYVHSDNLKLYTYENLGVGQTISCKLYMWIDYYYETPGKIFEASIVVDGQSKDIIVNSKSSAKVINELKTTKLTSSNSLTEDNITYISGCSKFYYEQSISNCTAANLIDFNYVWYSGRMWRIVSFNETTNTIKLITEQPQTAIAFNADATNDATKVNFYNNASDTSYIYQWLNEDFYDSLYNPDDVINKTIQFNATQTSGVTTKPATTTMVTPTNGIGLINAYEYTRTYNKVGSSSSYYGYLNIGQHWWLLNPQSASGVWFVGNDSIGNYYSPTLTRGARPSINLKSGVTFTGSGTEDDPYRIIGDKEIPDNTKTPINSRNIGEYIKLKSGNNEQVFRIVSFEGSGNSKTTKVVAIDYANSGNTLKFATSNSSGNGTVWGSGNTTGSGTWYEYLNNTYLPNLRTTYGSGMFTSGTYYLGWKATTPSDTTTTYNYKTSICSSDTTDPVSTCTKASGTYQTFDIGLLRYGEMFASQHGIGYNYKTSSYLTNSMFLLTRNGASSVWFVDDVGGGFSRSPTNAYRARPSVNLSFGVKILSGSGTELDPFVVG